MAYGQNTSFVFLSVSGWNRNRSGRCSYYSYALALLAWCCLGCLAPVASAEDTFQDFHNNPQGPMYVSNVVSSARMGTNGTGIWGIYNQTEFGTFFCTNEPALTFPSPVIVGTNTFLTTGTNFAACVMKNGGVEDVNFYLPGGSGSNYTKLCIKAFWRFGTTNNTFTQDNYDLIDTEGNPFGIMQQQTLQTMNRIVAHTPSGTGPFPFNLDPKQWYYITFFRDDLGGIVRFRAYDPSTFALLGETTETFSGTWCWWVRFQANYIGLGVTGGVNEFGGVSIDWGPHASDNIIVTQPIINPTNRIDWIPGQTVGVRGGIPVVSTIYTNEYSTNSLAELNANLAACPSNQVVFLAETNPANVYNYGGNIAMNKSGVVLRGANPTNTIVFGHISRGHSQQIQLPMPVTYGGYKGTTNCGLAYLTNIFNHSIAVNDMLWFSAYFANTNQNFPVISVAGLKAAIGTNVSQIYQPILVVGLTGTNVTFWPPLVFDFTNSPVLIPTTDFGNAGLRPVSYIGCENFTITMTNAGSVDNATVVIDDNMIRDSWLTNVTMLYVNNYGYEVENGMFLQPDSCMVRYGLSTGTSHAGMIFAHGSGCLIQNNIVADTQVCGYEINDGFLGNAFFANYSTNNTLNGDFLHHNTHPMMNLFEANVQATNTTRWEVDGYFGSASHETLFRNFIPCSLTFNRFITHMNVVGNVIGIYPSTPLYLQKTNAFSVYPVFNFGFPNITANTYVDEAPTQVWWNWPGAYLSDINFPSHTLTNGQFTFNATVITNTIWTNMGVGVLTNLQVGSAYPLLFQDTLADTNLYYPLDGSVYYVTNSTPSNVTLNASLSLSNGWRIYMGGQTAYQHYNPSNYYTHELHGNLLYTNQAGTLVWDSSNSNHSIPFSLLYTNGAPSWWIVSGTNAPWPAIGPDLNPVASVIPAQARFANAPVSDPAITTDPQSTTVVVGATATFTVSATGTSPLHYFWTFNGSAVGTDSSSYSKTGCQQTDNGLIAQVTVSNSVSQVTSAGAILTVTNGLLSIVHFMSPGTSQYIGSGAIYIGQ